MALRFGELTARAPAPRGRGGVGGGIDIGAKAEVHHIINELAAEGIAIIMISSDLPEVLAMSDRILVMREGRQMVIIDGTDATQESVMTAAMGQIN